MDAALAAEVDELWWEGAPKGHAADLLSGIQHLIPRCRKRLLEAWRVYGAWNRLEFPDRAPPMDRGPDAGDRREVLGARCLADGGGDHVGLPVLRADG